MIQKYLKKYFIYAVLLHCIALHSKDTFVEFKASYFLFQERWLRTTFNNGGALFGPEVTAQLFKEKNIYGFVSVDFLTRKGTAPSSCGPVKLHLMPLAVGLKYLMPFCYGDFYLGLGFQTLRVKTFNEYPYLPCSITKWGNGGIAKAGIYIDLPHNIVVDLFAAYSIVHVGCKNNIISPANLFTAKTNLSGAVFGASLGYRF